jgi:Acetyltransferase (GNAT) domain/Acetyltransferase (GNAT) family
MISHAAVADTVQTPHIRVMEPTEVELAIEWAAREGWNPGLADAEAFHATDPDGFLIAEDAERRPAACISAVRHGDPLGFIGFYIVAPARRGQGFGMAIWRAGMARLAGRLVGLDGVVEQQAAYARSGFTAAWRNLRYGAAAPRPVAVPDGAAAVVPAASVPFAALAAYDAALAGAPRHSFLRAWLAAPGHVALAAVRGGSVAGLGVLRPCREGAKLGPLFADDAATARALFAALAPSGPLFLDVPEPNADAAALAREAGMEPGFETARMYAGPPPAIPLRRVFGISTFELG